LETGIGHGLEMRGSLQPKVANSPTTPRLQLGLAQKGKAVTRREQLLLLRCCMHACSSKQRAPRPAGKRVEIAIESLTTVLAVADAMAPDAGLAGILLAVDEHGCQKYDAGRLAAHGPSFAVLANPRGSRTRVFRTLLQQTASTRCSTAKVQNEPLESKAPRV
jgi:hypothetical protein